MSIRRPAPPSRPPSRAPAPRRSRSAPNIPWLTIVGGILIVAALLIVGGILVRPLLTSRSTPRTASPRATSTVTAPTAVAATPSGSGATPAPVATTILAPAQLFADDFTTGLSPTWEIGFGEWRMVNERMKVLSFVNGRAQIFTGDPAWQDYAVDLDAGSFSHDWIAGDDNSVAVYVRLQDRSNTMWFQIAAYGAACGFKREGEDTVIHMQEGEVGRGDHHLRVEAKGNKYEFLVDGQRICFFEDDTFSSGSVGIWAAQGRDENEVWIDNFKVTQLP
ncbi:MAG: hypothetical protein JXA21_07460 [Anaerolineae bacterium]|nr:hypothetical protein [Anaerolineae bacterium]